MNLKYIGESFNRTFLSRYSIHIINKKEQKQEFNYCLSCFDQSIAKLMLIGND